MRPATDNPSIRDVRADAVFVSDLQPDLQPSRQPGASQVRQAAAAAIRAFGYPGYAGRVA